MISNLRTHRVNGQYAYRAWDGKWYIIGRDGQATGESFASRGHAVAAMAAC